MLSEMSGVNLLYEPYFDVIFNCNNMGLAIPNCIQVTDFALLDVFYQSIDVSNVVFNTIFISPSEKRLLNFLSTVKNSNILFIIEERELSYWEENFNYLQYQNIELVVVDIYDVLLERGMKAFSNHGC